MSVSRFALEVVSRFLVRRIPAAVYMFIALVSFVAARAGSFSDSMSGTVVMFIGISMATAFAIAGAWFLIKAPANVRKFFKDRSYGVPIFAGALMYLYILVETDTCLAQNWAGVAARCIASMMLTMLTAITAFLLIKGNR
jgi:hypothetical protein